MQPTSKIRLLTVKLAALLFVPALVCSSAVFAQVNDECGGAIRLVAGLNGPFDNTQATSSLPAWPCGGGASRDLWFTYTASSTVMASASTCGNHTNFDTRIEVFENSCGSLNSLGCNDDFCGLQSELEFPITAGTTYLIRVGGFLGASGTFDLHLLVRDGDECTTAIPVSAGSNGPFDNRGATDSPERWPCGGSRSADQWYSFTANCYGDLFISTCGGTTNFDTKIQVFSGNCGNLTSLGCSDGGCTMGSNLTIRNAVAFRTYMIRVGGIQGQVGDYELTVTCAGTATPPNDECMNAIPVSEGLSDTYANVNATHSGSRLPCNAEKDVWFSFVPTCSSTVVINTCAVVDFDTTLGLWSGPCGAQSLVICNDDSCGRQSEVRAQVTAVRRTTFRWADSWGARACSGWTFTTMPATAPFSASRLAAVPAFR